MFKWRARPLITSNAVAKRREIWSDSMMQGQAYFDDVRAGMIDEASKKRAAKRAWKSRQKETRKNGGRLACKFRARCACNNGTAHNNETTGEFFSQRPHLKAL
jgi:hypothetical protein